MYSMTNDASTLDRNFASGKFHASTKRHRQSDASDDSGIFRNRSNGGVKRAARQQALLDEADMDLRHARLGYGSDEDDLDD